MNRVEKLNTMPLVGEARKLAIALHGSIGQMYGAYPYHKHLEMVEEVGLKYAHLIPAELSTNPSVVEGVFCAIWLHDVLEDCPTKINYTQIKNQFGVNVAEVVFALTTPKGRNRNEKHSSEYYKDMRYTEHATFVKLCDRIANVKFSIETNSSKLEMYKNDYPFYKWLYQERYSDMFDELCGLLGENPKGLWK